MSTNKSKTHKQVLPVQHPTKVVTYSTIKWPTNPSHVLITSSEAYAFAKECEMQSDYWEYYEKEHKKCGGNCEKFIGNPRLWCDECLNGCDGCGSSVCPFCEYEDCQCNGDPNAFMSSEQLQRQAWEKHNGQENDNGM